MGLWPFKNRYSLLDIVIYSQPVQASSPEHKESRSKSRTPTVSVNIKPGGLKRYGISRISAIADCLLAQASACAYTIPLKKIYKFILKKLTQ
jgi:hypothetical protein